MFIMAEFYDRKLYAVVEFLENVEYTKSIDLVPSKWIKEENGIFYCKYPPTDDYPKVDKFASNLCEADENWGTYIVEILSYADTYSKGKKRLNRAFKSKDIRSTDEEACSQVTTPTVLSKQILTEELRTVSTMGFSLSASTSEKNLNESQKKKTAINDITEISEGTEFEVFDFDSMKKYIDKKINDQTALLHRYLVNEKRSLQYDLKKHFEEMKNNVINNRSRPHQESTLALSAALNVTLPLRDLEEFQKFDDDLKSIESKKNALLSLFRVNIYGETTVQACIRRMATTILTKNIEQHYSGTGKVIKGVAKLNFSNTGTFQCMKDVVSEKFGDSGEIKNFAGKVGRWLSGWADRENGRRER